MARTGGIVNFNTFVKGLITEASPLTFPENASSREENFELRRDGSRARRLGLDFEADYLSDNTLDQSYVDSSLITTYNWDNAGGTETDNFIVVQVGQYLYIYKIESVPTSAGLRSFTIDLEDHIVAGKSLLSIKNRPIDVAPLKGLLVVTSDSLEPFYISYDGGSGLFSTKNITIETRDLIGVPDETANVTERPDTLSLKHKYNLLNQGWTEENIDQTAELPAATPPGLGVYPSNADISHLAKSTTYDSSVTDWKITDIGTYKPELLDREMFGTTPAPKGKFVFEVFNRQYVDTTASETTPISSMSYDGTSITTDMGATPHGLEKGDKIKFKDIEIILEWTEQDSGQEYEGVTTVKAIVLREPTDTVSNTYFVVDSIPTTTTLTVKWFMDLTSSLWDPSDTYWEYPGSYGEYGQYGYVSDARIRSIGANDNAGVVFPEPVIIESDAEDFRPRTVAGYAGRAWYSGIRSNIYGSYIFYSQILESDENIGKCYQDADPTSEHISDLIDTDGGYIIIPTARGIQELVPVGEYLFVFSNNGVWRIAGDDGGNFKATGFTIDKVSDVGVYSRSSIVAVESEIYYWAEGGIYKIAQEEVSGNFVAVNVSQLTIQTAFDEIGAGPRQYVKGLYDPVEKKINWLYNRDLSNDGTRFNYNSILIYDTMLDAFYKYLVPIHSSGSGPFIASASKLTGTIYEAETSNVVICAHNVVVGSSNVITSRPVPAFDVTRVKYLTIVPVGTDYFITFSDFNNTGFLDFEDYDSIGVDAAAYLITGDDLQGSPANKKQAHYLLMYFNRTETLITAGEADNPSGCLVNVLWDWATDINSVRAGSQFQAYRLNRLWLHSTANSPDTYTYGEDVVVTKSKLRGRGRAISLAMQSEPGKDLHLLGWSLLMSGGQKV